MIDLLSGLERFLSLVSDVSVKLRGHVAQIETYMDQAAQTAQQSQVFHSVVPRLTSESITALPTGANVDVSAATAAQPTTTSPTDDFARQLDMWANEVTFEWPPDHQLALQADLTANWPFDIGGRLYEYFGEGSGGVQDRHGNNGF
jgi:hypothetical protein